MKISELFDGTCPAGLPLDESPIRTERVLGLVRADIRAEKRPRRLHRTLRTALIAAVLTLALSVTAWAAYELFIDKYVIDQPAVLETEEAAAERPQVRVSLTGYQGTPEYMAYTEWEAYQSDWWAKAMENDPWQERGVDDSWHETPDNYYGLYNASFQEQADALDAIVEKYGLTLHQDIASYYQSKDLYEALGTEPFFGDAIDPIDENYDVGGYIYDDGSFKAEFYELLSGERQVSMSMFVNAKGSFATISGLVEQTEDSEAWQYTTASGETVDLYFSSNNVEIMAESAGAYMEVGMQTGSAPAYDPATDPQLSEEQKQFYLEGCLQADPDMTEAEQEEAWQDFYDDWVAQQQSYLPPAITREDLETIADSIDFAILAKRFDGAPHPETADMLAVLKEREQARYAADEAVSAGFQVQLENVLETMGRYAPSAFPDAFADMLIGGMEPLDPEQIGLEGRAMYAQGVFFPSAEEADCLSYYHVVDASTAPGAFVQTIRSWLAEKFPDGKVTDETVQGCPAAMVLLPDHGAVYWHDEGVELLFVIEVDDMSDAPAVDRDAVLALAESVEKVE